MCFRKQACAISPAPAPEMPLTLRPTGLSGNPDASDWSVHEDGAEIGRFYEDRQGDPVREPVVLVDYDHGAGALPRPH